MNEPALFRTNPIYEAHIFPDHESWLHGRSELHGVGASDSAAAIGQSKWASNRRLWMLKTGRKVPEDISSLPAVRYGTLSEACIRAQYSIDVEDKYEVQYVPDTILKSAKYPYMLYSPDGLLQEKGSDRYGLLEIKTAQIRGNGENWHDHIPQNYFIQVLHGLAVIGGDFAELRALLRYSDEYSAVRTYHIERADHEDDIQAVIEGVSDFWSYVENDIEPPQILPEI